jgi:hypothetical protein
MLSEMSFFDFVKTQKCLNTKWLNTITMALLIFFNNVVLIEKKNKAKIYKKSYIFYSKNLL